MTLTIKDLSFSYKDNNVLNNISFNANDGEVIALLGKNGSGKTTLLKNILGLLTPSSGTILVDDKDLSKLSVRDRSKLLSYIPQSPSNIWSYSVKSYVLMGITPSLSTLSSPKEKDDAKAIDVLERFGISSLADRDITTLSGGERQLATAARALLQNSRIQLFDEPTSNLDLKNADILIRHIKSLSKEGYISLITMHDITEALNIASRILILDRGKVFFNDSVDKLSSEILSEYYQTMMNIERYKNQYIVLKEGVWCGGVMIK